MTGNLNGNKRIAKNTMFLYMRMIVVLFLTLYISRVILNVLGVEDYGIYNVVGGFVSMFSFLNTSMSNAVQRFYNFDLGANKGINISVIFSTSIFIQLLLAVFLFIIAEFIGIWYINNIMVIPDNRIIAANWVFQISLISFLFVIIQVPYAAAVMAYEKMNFFAFVSLVDVILRFAVAFCLKYLTNIDSLILYAMCILMISIICFVLYLFYTKLQFRNIHFTKISKVHFVRMLSFSGWNAFGSFAYMLKDQGLNLLLNVYFGPIVNAARAISYQVSSALNSFSSNIFTAFRPQLIQSYSSKDYLRTTGLMFTMSKFTYFLMVLFAFPIIIEIKYILYLWLGYNVPEDTELFTVLVIANMLITNFNPPVSQIVHATGKMKNYQIITSLVLTSILPISWIFLHFGSSADVVFWISLVIAVINQLVCLIVLKQIYPYSIRSYILKVLLPCFFVSIIVFPITYSIHKVISFDLIRFISVILVNLLISILVIFVIGLTTKERNMILKMKKKNR